MYRQKDFVPRIIHTKIIKLSKNPFQKKKNVNPVFQKIFNNKNCLSDFLEINQNERNKFFFFRNIGQFNSFNCYYRAENHPPFYSYIDDERSYLCYYKIKNGIYISAHFNDNLVAEGKIYIHVYPLGFIAIILSISLINPRIDNLMALYNIISQTNPETNKELWEWNSRVKKWNTHEKKSLRKIFEEIEKNILDSIFKKIHLGTIGFDTPWFSFLILHDIAEKTGVQDFLIEEESVIFDYRLLPSYSTYNPSFLDYEYLIISKSQLVCGISSLREPSQISTFIWNIQKIYEYMKIQLGIFNDLVIYFVIETKKLKDANRSYIPRSKRALVRYTAYSPKILDFLKLNEQSARFVITAGLKPTYKEILGKISKGIEFNKLRGELSRAIEAYEEEAKLWEPYLIRLIKLIGKPLSKIFDLFKK